MDQILRDVAKRLAEVPPPYYPAVPLLLSDAMAAYVQQQFELHNPYHDARGRFTSGPDSLGRNARVEKHEALVRVPKSEFPMTTAQKRAEARAVALVHKDPSALVDQYMQKFGAKGIHNKDYPGATVISADDAKSLFKDFQKNPGLVCK